MRHIFLALVLSGYSYANADTFSEAVTEIIMADPTIRSAALNDEAELLSARADNNLRDPEIEAGYKWGDGAEDKYDVSVTQGFDWPGVYGKRSQSNRLRRDAIGSLQRSRLIDARQKARQLLVDIVHVNKMLTLFNKRKATIDSLVEVYTVGARRDEFTKIDLYKIRLQQLAVDGNIADARQQREALAASLAVMTGNASGLERLMDMDEYSDRLSILPADTYKELLANDPAAEYSDLMIRAQRKQSDAEKLMGLPSFSLGYQYAREEGHSFNGPVVGISLPIFSNRHKAKSSRMIEEAMASDALTAQVEREASAMAARDRALSAFQLYQGYDRIVIGNTELPRLLRIALDGGQISMLDYLTEMDYLHQATLDALNAQYSYQSLLVELNRLVD